MAEEIQLEQSFNDQELADIMNEIENLEKEFVAPSPPIIPNEAKSEPLSEPQSEKIMKEEPLAEKIEKKSNLEGRSPLKDKFSEEDLSNGLGITVKENVDQNQLRYEIDQKTSLQAKIDEEILESKKQAEEIITEIVPMDKKEGMEDEKTDDLLFAGLREEKINDINNLDVDEEKENYMEISSHHQVLSSEKTTASKDLNVNSFEEKNGNLATTQMDFNVAGDMDLKLCFHISGQKIHLTLDKAQGLMIELPGGAKFILPLSK